MHKKQGFTLVELLVVVAVIGLLASIIIVSLNSARNRAKNTAIKQALVELRIAAEWEYDQDEDYYDVCDDGDAGEGTTNDLTLDGGNFERIRKTIRDNGGDEYCRDGTIAATGVKGWCAEVENMPNGGGWCTDYTGYSGSATACDGINFNCPSS